MVYKIFEMDYNRNTKDFRKLIFFYLKYAPVRLQFYRIW